MEKILFISPSTQNKSTWALTVILGIAPMAFFGWKMLSLTSGFNFWVLMFAIFLLLCVVGFVATPYKYILTGAHLVVKRYWRDVSIPLSDIKIIRLITEDEKKTIWRSFGYAGPFGYFGVFSSSKLSKLHVCARRYTNLTLVTTESKNYLFAPDDPQLIEAVRDKIRDKR